MTGHARQLTAAALALTLSAAGSCRSVPAGQIGGETDAPLVFVTDSTRYGVRRDGAMYRADIGYRLTNRSGRTISQNYCQTPTPPALEKLVGGSWVTAYNAVVRLCLTLPPFRVRHGETYRGVVRLAAAPPGRGIAPELLVESGPGTYRLRWRFSAGEDPEANQPTVEAISNEFQLVER